MILAYYICVTKQKDMNTQQFNIEATMTKIMDLATNADFIAKSVEVAKQLGITAQEWNENKPALLMYFAKEALKSTNQF